MNRPKFNNTSVTVIASIVFAAFLFLLPTGFEGALQFRDAVKCKALVEDIDNSRIRTLEKQDGLTHEFDAGIWSSLVQEVIVKSKDDIRFIFKNGFEVRV